MGLLGRGRTLLLALVTALVLSNSPATAVQSMSRNWFRNKVAKLKSVAGMFKSPKHVPTGDIAELGTVKEFLERLHMAGFRRPQNEEELLKLFSVIKTCFRNFAPPPGLALDFTPKSSASPQETISQLFMFFKPEKLIFDPTPRELEQLSLRETTEGGAAPAEAEAVGEAGLPDDENTPVEPSPLRPVKFAADSKQILATIIKSVLVHFRGPSCQRALKGLDGISRFFLRSNTKAGAVEPLLVFALIQGNAASAERFAHSTARVPSADLNADLTPRESTATVPANLSLNPGIYDPAMIASFFDVAKMSGTSPMKKLEKQLTKKPVDELAVGARLFGNSLANPETHKKVTHIGKTVNMNEGLLQNLVKRIGNMAIDSSDALSILLPEYPQIAALVRGVTFFAFEGVFKQQGSYVMPGLPCDGDLKGNMKETLTGKKLGVQYYVYKYTQAVHAELRLPDKVWSFDGESPVRQFFKQRSEANGGYLVDHIPRVCVRSALFDKCSKALPNTMTALEDLLCGFIFLHRGLFFQVNGKGVYAMRKNMQKAMNPPSSRFQRARSALGRSLRGIRRFLFSKATLALVVGASIGAMCSAAGLSGVLAGSLCAVGAMGASSLFSTLFGVAPFGGKPILPLGIGEFLAADFERNLDAVEHILHQPAIAAPATGIASPATGLP